MLGSLLLAGSVGSAVAATAVLGADQVGRDADGFLGTPEQRFSSAGYAMVFDPVELHDDAGAVDLGAVLGDVRIQATGADPDGVFVGIGPAADVDAYLAGVDRERLVDLGRNGRPVQQYLPGGAPATPPRPRTGTSPAARRPGWTRSACWAPSTR